MPGMEVLVRRGDPCQQRGRRLQIPVRICHAGMADYAKAVDAAQPAVNVAALMGHTALRMRHMADLGRAANAEECAAMAHAD